VQLSIADLFVLGNLVWIFTIEVLIHGADAASLSLPSKGAFLNGHVDDLGIGEQSSSRDRVLVLVFVTQFGG